MFHFIPCCPYTYALPLCRCFDKGFYLKCQHASPQVSQPLHFPVSRNPFRKPTSVFGNSVTKRDRQTDRDRELERHTQRQKKKKKRRRTRRRKKDCLVLLWFVSVSPCSWVVWVFSFEDLTANLVSIFEQCNQPPVFVLITQVHDQSIKGIMYHGFGSLFGGHIAYYYCKKMSCHDSYLMY